LVTKSVSSVGMGGVVALPAPCRKHVRRSRRDHAEMNWPAFARILPLSRYIWKSG